MNRLRWPAADNVVLKSVTEIYLTLHPKTTDFVSFFRFFLQPKKLKSDLILVLVGRWRRNLADIRANGLLI